MGIRFPLLTVLDARDTGDVGAGSIAGGVAFPFTIPQDSDGLVVKMTASLVGTSVTALLQTTDDGGTTWFDVARTTGVTVTGNATAGHAAAVWLSTPVTGFGFRTSTTPVASATSGVTAYSILGTPGRAEASSLGAGTASGLPIMSTRNRIFIQYTGNVTTNDLTRVEVKVQSQSQGV